MVSPFLMAVPVTIVPAMAALWSFLRRYEGYFDDRRVFFSLVVGFFSGLVATAFEFVAFPFADPLFVAQMGGFAAFAFFVAGYAFFETGAKVVVLGARRFRQRKDTPYYGAALGLGFGAMAALMFVAVGLASVEAFGLSGRDALFARTIVILVPLGTVLTHGATGVWVGQGSADGVLWRGWVMGALLQMPALTAFWLLVGPVGEFTPLRFVGAAVISIAYGSILLHVTRKRILDTIVPPEVRQQMRRHMRAARRARGEEAAPGAGNDPSRGPGDGAGKPPQQP